MWSLIWVLSLMVKLQPNAPWKDNYYHVAQGILDGATAEPIFTGQYGFQRTVALDVSLAWFESRFDFRAIGDKGRSWGLFQFQGKGKPEEIKEQVEIANRLIRQSFAVCKGKEWDEKLGWYAAGGPDCERGLRESRHRMRVAKILFQ